MAGGALDKSPLEGDSGIGRSATAPRYMIRIGGPTSAFCRRIDRFSGSYVTGPPTLSLSQYLLAAGIRNPSPSIGARNDLLCIKLLCNNGDESTRRKRHYPA